MDNSSRVVVGRNLLWRLAERVGAKGVEFLVSIILARLLAPSVYGEIALITVFITILQVFVDSGLGNALIQKKDADIEDYSSVLHISMLIALLLYLIMFFAAPTIANLYDKQLLIRFADVLGNYSGELNNVYKKYYSKITLCCSKNRNNNGRKDCYKNR